MKANEMSTCWTCAKIYDQKVTSSPTHYCSGECYDYGARPYHTNKPVENNIKSFTIKLVDRIHYLQHNDNDRNECEWDPCLEAKILGL